MQKTLVIIALAALLMAAAPASTPDYANQIVSGPTAVDHHHDFDFEFGTWRTHYRLLKHRLVGSHEWMDCYGTSVIRPFWNGYGNLEDGDLQCPTKYYGGMTARLYSPNTHMWSLYWGTKKIGIALPPQIGHFDDDGVGRFYAPDIQEGKHVIIRFQWTAVNGNPHFEQAFTTDRGKTWETNWTTDYERVPETDKGVWNRVAPADGHAAFDYVQGTWIVQTRILGHALAGAHDWYACTGHAKFAQFWGGGAALEDHDMTCPNRFVRGVGIYVYLAAARQWQMWIGTEAAGLLFAPPTAGTVDAKGNGAFYSHDTYKGKPVYVRQTWKPLGANRAYFDQAFSTDGGKTWEVNWTTTYTRVGAAM